MKLSFEVNCKTTLLLQLEKPNSLKKKKNIIVTSSFKYSTSLRYNRTQEQQWETLLAKSPRIGRTWRTSGCTRDAQETYRFRSLLHVGQMTAYYSPLIPLPLAKNSGNTTWNRSRAAWIIIHFVLRELTYASVFVHLHSLHPSLPVVRVQHRVRADFERRRPGGRRTFISGIGLHDRHLITTGPGYPLFTPFLHRPSRSPFFLGGGRGCCEGDRYRCGVVASK